jgi:mannose-1-phosphate guanylyltransferase
MQALILAGGRGTRLRPLTLHTPKPVVPLAGRPFLLFQIDILRRAGITDIVLSLNYQPDKIELLLDDGREHGVNLSYVTEPSPLGTAGAYRFASRSNNKPTVVLNGDILTDIDLSAVLAFHTQNKAEATIVLTPVENPSNYGLVETEEGRVLRFREKPRPEEIAELSTKNINAGIYILESGVADLIPVDEIYSFEYNLFPELLARGTRFFAYEMSGSYWRDIGTPSSYLSANMDFLENRIAGFDLKRAREFDISPSAVVDRASVVATDCQIKANARVSNSVVGAGVHIEEKAVIENSVIWPHARVSTGAHVSDAIIGRGCHIGKNCIVGPGSVLGDKTSLTDYSRF